MRKGDALAVVAPSGPPATDALLRGLTELASQFDVRVAPSATTPTSPPGAAYLAASDRQRADELNAMLADPDIRGIVMARGGYGLMRILPMLDASLVRADPKPIVGFSDGTALLSWAWQAGVRGIHGQVVVRIGGERPEALGELVRALTDPSPLGLLPWRLSGPRPAGAAMRCTAPIIPANLVMAAHLVATPWQLPLADAAMWLEEVGERPYELDRALTHLWLSGSLRDTRAVVIGDLVRCTEPPTAPVDDPSEARAVVRERLQAFGLPALFGAAFGHGRFNPPLPFGALARHDWEAGAVEILEGAVA